MEEIAYRSDGVNSEMRNCRRHAKCLVQLAYEAPSLRLPVLCQLAGFRTEVYGTFQCPARMSEHLALAPGHSGAGREMLECP
jgi:hypothetical protein